MIAKRRETGDDLTQKLEPLACKVVSYGCQPSRVAARPRQAGTLPVKLTVDLVLKYRLPSLSTQKSAVQAGIFMSYTGSFAERANIIASYVDQIVERRQAGRSSGAAADQVR